MSGAGPGYQYHLLRGALDVFSRNLAELDETQLVEARRRADRTYSLESLVLASDEAADVVIPAEQVEGAFAQVSSRYPDPSALQSDLAANGLTEGLLRQALHRELVFDSVMQRIAATRLTTSELDARLYYELHSDKFTVPERRRARQILITINEEYRDNTPLAARARIDTVAEKLKRNPRRFADQARRYSECPSALEGGKLGDVRRGQLFSQLDGALFALQEGALSEVLETEVGFHLLLCEKVMPARSMPFSAVESGIRKLLDERNRRNCQKAFLRQLQETSRGMQD
jgi:peptidyl-prolyl cis-trans isomerase C